ncbi:oxidoreductase [Mycena alexandri]|uniref:Oxidoreductase n=1 Tax=Mycena alexandri TaxID=1745969 RepID=A0AAD6T969_9AGAR|nr:oxidoreductase [Mycena alexandri]
MWFSKAWNPDGLATHMRYWRKLSLALILASKGAHVSIVARNQARLNKALQAIEVRLHLERILARSDQLLAVYSFDLGTYAGSADALGAVCKPHDDRSPDAIFNCAGSSKPMFFVDMSEDDMTAWTTMVTCSKEDDARGAKGKIVLVSSTLGHMSLVGWSSYSPAKHALRGLADTLQSEFMLYDGMDVHMFFPRTMFTLGYDEENKTKPKIARDIESTDDGLTPDVAAQGFSKVDRLSRRRNSHIYHLKRDSKGHAHITGDIITTMFRPSTRGVAPRHNILLEIGYDLAATVRLHLAPPRFTYLGVQIIAPIWRNGVDKRVRAHRAEHQQHLRDSGFFS